MAMDKANKLRIYPVKYIVVVVNIFSLLLCSTIAGQVYALVDQFPLSIHLLETLSETIRKRHNN